MKNTPTEISVGVFSFLTMLFYLILKKNKNIKTQIRNTVVSIFLLYKES